MLKLITSFTIFLSLTSLIMYGVVYSIFASIQGDSNVKVLANYLYEQDQKKFIYEQQIYLANQKNVVEGKPIALDKACRSLDLIGFINNNLSCK